MTISLYHPSLPFGEENHLRVTEFVRSVISLVDKDKVWKMFFSILRETEWALEAQGETRVVEETLNLRPTLLRMMEQLTSEESQRPASIWQMSQAPLSVTFPEAMFGLRTAQGLLLRSLVEAISSASLSGHLSSRGTSLLENSGLTPQILIYQGVDPHTTILELRWVPQD